MNSKKEANTLYPSEHTIKPIVQIGKGGLTENIVEDIEKHLKKRKIIKIKCLRYFLESYDLENSNKIKIKEIADMLSKKLKCKTKTIGFVIVLKK